MSNMSDRCLSGYGLVVQDGFAWVVHEGTNSLCKVDLGSRKVDFICYLGVDGLLTRSRYLGMALINDRIIMPPAYQKNRLCIGDYDLRTNQLTCVDLEKASIDETAEPWCKFCLGVASLNDYVFSLGRTYPAIVRYNTETGDVCYFRQFLDENVHRRDLPFSYLFGNAEVYDDCLFVPDLLSRGLFRINCESGDTNYYSIETSAEGLSGIVSIGDGKFAIGCCGKGANHIIVWDYHKELLVQEIEIPNSATDTNAEIHMVYTHNRLYVFSRSFINDSGKRKFSICCVNMYTYQVDLVELPKEYLAPDSLDKDEWDCTYMGLKDDDTLLFITNGDNVWHEYNTLTNEYKEYFVTIDEDFMHDYCVDRIHNSTDTFIASESDVGMRTFLDVI